MPKTLSSSDDQDADPIRQWLLEERIRRETILAARVAARVRAGRRVWWVLTAHGWWVL